MEDEMSDASDDEEFFLNYLDPFAPDASGDE